jgi:hypothetical protein
LAPLLERRRVGCLVALGNAIEPGERRALIEKPAIQNVVAVFAASQLTALSRNLRVRAMSKVSQAQSCHSDQSLQLVVARAFSAAQRDTQQNACELSRGDNMFTQ